MSDENGNNYVLPRASVRITATYREGDTRAPETLDVEINEPALATLATLTHILGDLANLAGRTRTSITWNANGASARTGSAHDVATMLLDGDR